MAGKAGRSGGKRPGAGRKPRSERFARPIAAAEKRIADRLPQTIDNLESLADGGYQRVKEKWEPAGLILIDGVVRDKEGKPLLDSDGKPVKGRVPAFPDLTPETLVLVERQTERADADRAANIYLIDRILGKPAQSVEAEVTVLQKMAREVEKLTDAELLSLVGGDGDQEAAGTG